MRTSRRGHTATRVSRTLIGLSTTIALGVTLLPGATAQAASPATGAASSSVAKSAAAKPKGYRPRIVWGACSSDRLKEAGAECGTIKVPLDWSRKNGRKISLAVSRIKHTSAKSQGVMLVNPGGPGGSGLTLSVLGEYVPDGVGQSYDWIGFDPRGVGESKPALSCVGNYFKAPRPAYVPSKNKKNLRQWTKRSVRYARACGNSKARRLLDHVTTRDSSRDMNAIRGALGVKKINYYGFSYGTYLGQVFATMYPGRVRRMIFDGNVDPTKVFYKSNLGQNTAFDRNIDIYFGWLARYDSVYHLGTTRKQVRTGYYRVLRKLTRKPMGALGAAELSDAMLGAGYYVYGWQETAEQYAALVNDKDPKPILAAYRDGNPTGPGADNGFAMYLATQCTDARWPKLSKTLADARRQNREHPFLTWGNFWFNAPCSYWPGKSRKPVKVNGKKAPKILLISETKDAATPFSGSLKVRKLFPRSSLVAGVGGTTHAGSLSGVACVDNTIADYLRDGTLPKRKTRQGVWDKACGYVPRPDPTVTRPGRKAGDDLHTLLAKLQRP